MEIDAKFIFCPKTKDALLASFKQTRTDPKFTEVNGKTHRLQVSWGEKPGTNRKDFNLSFY